MNRKVNVIRFPTPIRKEPNNKIIIGILYAICDLILEKLLICHIVIQESYYFKYLKIFTEHFIYSFVPTSQGEN